MSDTFTQQHPALVDAATHIMKSAASKYMFITTTDLIVQKRANPRNTQLLLFATERDEAAVPRNSKLKGVFTAQVWAKAMAQPLIGGCARGVCGH